VRQPDDLSVGLFDHLQGGQMNHVSNYYTALAAFACLISLSGCAQVIAAKQAAPLNRGMLVPGVERTRVIATFGTPIGHDTNDNGNMVETYSYTDGGQKNAFGSKAARILLYTAGDLFTLCLDQVIWMPMELAFKGTDYTCKVTYERSGDDWMVCRVKEVEAKSSKVVREMSEECRPTATSP
jgi:hypothetical protein